MGCIQSSEKKQANHRSLLLLGIDGAGSTTVLYQLVQHERVETIPTLAFNRETLAFEGMKYEIWDIGGNDKVRPLWTKYAREAHAIIYVVDATDKTRLPMAARELKLFIDDSENNHYPTSKNPLLIFANKQEMDGAKNVDEMREALGMDSLPFTNYKIVGCSAKTGDNLNDGLHWLTQQLKDPE
uniref:Uncharacterized protein n=1 Tax=Rhodosorus marinus TaxID=101924 RepID=A0A7S0BQY1_9RHOD|mmetsp:Transcript_4677/g.6475  ORF Transcript_4677/g.6475 Transcript_4677/m.6475 type:complete len:184 (+) Transcript_4677:237-788(+)